MLAETGNFDSVTVVDKAAGVVFGRKAQQRAVREL